VQKKSKGENFMVEAITLFGWTFIIGFVVLAAYLTSENDSRNSKVHKDLNETMLNRNEDV
jgi:hypothetical protein